MGKVSIGDLLIFFKTKFLQSTGNSNRPRRFTDPVEDEHPRKPGAY